MTWIFQAHKWRGLSAERDLMDCIFVCGFVTVFVSRRPLLDKIVKLLKAERDIRAARGEVPHRVRTSHGKPERK